MERMSRQRIAAVCIDCGRPTVRALRCKNCARNHRYRTRPEYRARRAEQNRRAELARRERLGLPPPCSQDGPEDVAAREATTDAMLDLLGRGLSLRRVGAAFGVTGETVRLRLDAPSRTATPPSARASPARRRA